MNNMNLFYLEPRQSYLPFIQRLNDFCKDECDFIKTLGLEFGLKSSLVSKGLDSTVRRSSNAFIPLSQETEWIYKKIHKIAVEVNDFYNFNLSDFGEDLQFAKYSLGEFYNFHEDIGSGYSSLRKLTLSVNLTEDTDYDGGTIDFFTGGKVHTTSKQLGSVVVFPSYVPHRVRKITNGERYSLTSWIHGPPFA
jgi:PKHD-type hydroxylase